MQQRTGSHSEQGTYTLSFQKLFSNFTPSVCSLSLRYSSKGLNFVTIIPLHPACLSEFPLVAISTRFTRLSLVEESFGWNKLGENGAKITGFKVEQTMKIYEIVKQTNPCYRYFSRSFHHFYIYRL